MSGERSMWEPPVSPEWRRELWLSHGCPIPALYGDDGEMSCSNCLLDFRRMSAEGLAVSLGRLLLAARAEAAGRVARVQRVVPVMDVDWLRELMADGEADAVRDVAVLEALEGPDTALGDTPVVRAGKLPLAVVAFITIGLLTSAALLLLGGGAALLWSGFRKPPVAWAALFITACVGLWWRARAVRREAIKQFAAEDPPDAPEADPRATLHE